MDNMDRRKLTVDQLDKLEAYDARQKQLSELKTIAGCMAEIKTVLADNTEVQKLDKLSSLLDSIHASLVAIQDKADPDPVDMTPVIKAIEKLKIQPEFKPQFTPNIQVDSPVTVDLSRLEKLLQTELPKLVDKMVPALPEFKVPDNSQQFDQIIKTLGEVRDRPIPLPSPPPNNVGLLSNGNKVGANNPLPVAGFIPGTYDYVSVAYPDAVTEVYTFKSGGSGGSLLCTVTIVYVDSTKALISSVTRT